jgi:hypothetical protein
MTLTIERRAFTDAPPEPYDLRDQYMPYFLAEDPTMPPDRARALLQEWSTNRPWEHYLDNSMNRAARQLATEPDLDDEQISLLVKTLRKHVFLEQQQRLSFSINTVTIYICGLSTSRAPPLLHEALLGKSGSRSLRAPS